MDERRRLIMQGLVASGITQLAGCESPVTAADERPAGPAEDPAGKMLILGGTGFVGPHIVRRAIAAGFEVTLFNRGRSNTDLFPDLELLIGDRDGDLDSVADAIAAGRRWESVVDLSGYGAEQVRDTARLLAAATGRYVFVSSVAAYASFSQPNDESSPVHTSRRDEYGPQKARAEREAEAAMPGRVTNVRPTIIGGPGDNTDRLTYWPARMERGGEMLVPGPADRPIQFVDVRDVADFVILCAQAPQTGTFNVVNPPGAYTMRQLIADCATATGVSADPVWVSPEFVEREQVGANNGLPLWDSPDGDRQAFPLISDAAARAHGLTTRPPLETIRDTFDWWQSLPDGRRAGLRAGLAPERERELIARWRATGG